MEYNDAMPPFIVILVFITISIVFVHEAPILNHSSERKEIVGLEPDEPASPPPTSDGNGGEKICSNVPFGKHKCPRTELDLSGSGKSQKDGNQVWLIKVPVRIARKLSNVFVPCTISSLGLLTAS